jgi:NAD(P)-dependent dehydrogenase (short-subunit alcohol dehydrogenase family)
MPATSTDKPHAGRIAVVTGAARGIGQATAVGLAEQGATVVIGDVGDLTETSELIAKAGHPALAAPLDISGPAVVEGVRERVADELGRLGRQVIHRMAEPDDIAGSVLILAADQAGWITGQTIMANGGNSFGL